LAAFASLRARKNSEAPAESSRAFDQLLQAGKMKGLQVLGKLVLAQLVQVLGQLEQSPVSSPQDWL
jgi:hypothetical protein